MLRRGLLVAALFIAGINRLLPLPRSWKWFPNDILASGVLVVFFLCNDESTAAVTAAAWWPITLTVRQVWHKPFTMWNCLRHGGPLGPGCSKVVEVVVGVVLWFSTRGEVPYLLLPATSDQHDSKVNLSESSAGTSLAKVAAQLWIVVVFSLVVFQVLRLWSRFTKSAGDHKGVQDMVAQGGQESLSFWDHVCWMALAFINATAEEYTSRGLWREEFQQTGQLSRGYSNMAQALIFGAWHFHGIPSGWTGVVLTTVYGWIMGSLSDWTGGNLIAPIVSHTLVDYFIFTVIVQKKTKD